MKKVVLAHVVQTFSDQFPSVAWVEMPLGAQPFGAVPHDDGLAILAIGDLDGLPVQHPLFIFPPGVPLEVPLGSRVGPYLGSCKLGENQAVIFCGSPWPLTAVDAQRPEGRG